MARTSVPVYNGYAPKEGPKVLPITLDFTTNGSISSNLFIEETSGIMSFVQGIYVDNSINPAAVTFNFGVTNQKLVVPANSQGIYPVFSPDQLTFIASTTPGAGILVPIFLMNVPAALTQWGPISVTVNNVTATFTPTVAPVTDRSGTITLGGTSQQLAAANANRKRIVIQAPTSNTESIFVNWTTAAALTGNSYELAPGGVYDSGTGPVSGEAINVVAASTGTKFMAKES